MSTPQWVNFANYPSSDTGVRPAGSSDRCFYCGTKVGDEHKPECVTLRKRAMVRFTVEMPVVMPKSWDAEMVAHYYGQGTWCASNFLELLEQLDTAVDDAPDEVTWCMCGMVHGELIEDPGALEEWARKHPLMAEHSVALHED